MAAGEKKNMPETNSYCHKNCACSSGTKIRPYFGSPLRRYNPLWLLAEMNQSKRRLGTMWPTSCKVHVTSCSQRSVSCKGSFPCCPCHTWCQAVTRQADCTLNAWKTAGRVTKWQRCVVLSPAVLTPALWACPTTEPNHFRQMGRGCIDCTFRLFPYPVDDRTQTEGFGEACVWNVFAW